MEDRIKELEDKIERLLLELGYLQGETTKIDGYKAKIKELEEEIVYYRERSDRVSDRWAEAVKERDTTRTASMEAIRLLQVELERANVSRETHPKQSGS